MDAMIGTVVDNSFTNRNIIQGGVGPQLNSPGNYSSHAAIRSALKTAYAWMTDAYINQLTENDAIYALRLAQDASSI